MKLGIDARMIYGPWEHRGIGRYIKSIIGKLPIENVLAFLPANQSVELYKTISQGTASFPIWEQFVLPRLAKNNHLDYLLCPSITSPLAKIDGLKKIVVVYDLIFMASFRDLPLSHSIYNNLGRLYRRFIAPKSYNAADVLIAISEFSKNELHAKFGIVKEKINVIPCSIPDEWFVKEILPAKSRQKYFVSVTGDAPSKNLNKILESFAIVLKSSIAKDFKLRIVGVAKKSKPIFEQQVKRLNIETNVIFESFLDNSQLQILYQNAWASVTLSLYEGFGIPIVEAMASGTPVICSDTTSMPEVAGYSAIYANPRIIESMTEAFLQIIATSEAQRDNLSSDGIKWAKKFSDSVVKNSIDRFWDSLTYG